MPSQVRTFRNDSQVAKDIGIPELKEETSRNFSAGFVSVPLRSHNHNRFYYILIDDRIVLPNRISASDSDLSQTVKDILAQERVRQAQFFMNAADTTTKGGGHSHELRSFLC